MTSKFDKLEKDQQKEKDKIINNLKGEVSSFSEKLGEIDTQQQYSRRNYLVLHGIKKTKGEDTGNVVLEALNNDMDFEYIKDCS